MTAISQRRAGRAPTRRATESYLQEINQHPAGQRFRDTDRPIVLYGAGNLGLLARHHLEFVGKPPILVVDAAARSVEKRPEWAGYAIMLPSEVPERVKTDAVLALSIVTQPFVPLQTILGQAGWHATVPFYDIAETFRDRHPLSNGWYAAPMSAGEESLARQVLDSWDDDQSRADHLRFFAWRICREEWLFDDVVVEPGNRFFIPQVRPFLTSDARVLDAGAHHGTFLDAVLRMTNGLSHAWAVEPDRQNATVLGAWHRALPDAQRAVVTLHDLVLSDRVAELPFHDGLGFASQISPTGRHVRATTTIDAQGWAPTIVKLHLEGHELAVLNGARETLVACRPLLMLTIYHNDDGLFRTALWLMTTLSQYRFYLRAHGWCGTGIVIYAVPEDKMR